LFYRLIWFILERVGFLILLRWINIDVSESLLAVDWFSEYKVIHSFLSKVYGNKLTSSSSFVDFKLGNLECSYTHDNGLEDQLTLLDDRIPP
jgi:hypothetical protein